MPFQENLLHGLKGKYQDSWLEKKLKSLLGLLRFKYVNLRANMIV